jgi:hypothetical protein
MVAYASVRGSTDQQAGEHQHYGLLASVHAQDCGRCRKGAG